MIEALTLVTTSKLVDRSGYDPEKLANFEKVTGILKTRQTERAAIYLAKDACEDVKARFPDEFKSIGTIIYVTQSQSREAPCHAASIQHWLDIDVKAAAFDINQSCTGFVYGLDIARKFAHVTGTRTLLVCVDKLRIRTRDVDDLIFSDAATATLIAPHGKVIRMLTKTEGFGVTDLFQLDGLLSMNGAAVFDYMTVNLPGIIRASNVWADYLVPHQANAMMLDIIEKRSGFAGRALRSISEYGNMSMNSIPATLCLNEERILGKELLLAGYGAGWSIATTSAHWSRQRVTRIIENEERET